MRIRIRDTRSGIRCLFDPWIWDPGWVKNQDPDPRSGSAMNNPDQSLETIFWVKILKFFDADSGSFLPWTRDPGWKKSGSGINIPEQKWRKRAPTVNRVNKKYSKTGKNSDMNSRISITLMRIRIQFFSFNADPDPASKIKADPYGSGSAIRYMDGCVCRLMKASAGG